MISWLKRAYQDESGQTLVVGTISLFAVLPFVAMAIDVGQIRYQKRQMQAAVDAAAISAAIEIGSCGGTNACSAMQTAASQALVENGLTASNILTQCATNSYTTLTLTVNNGPCAMGSSSVDPNYGNASYAEAVLTGPAKTLFARVIGINSIKITVRAEAHGGSSTQNCLVVGANYSSTWGTGMTLNGGTITASCGVYDDWNGSGALDEASSSGGITSTGFKVHGSGCAPCNGGNFGSNSPVYNSAALADPLSYLTTNGDTPTIGSCTGQSSLPSSGSTLSPGTFCSGMTLNSGVSVTLSSGTYIFEGPIILNSGTSLVGSGVTLYLTGGGSLIANSNTSNISLTAPTSGTLAGIAIWQASSDSIPMIIDAGSYLNVAGAVYAPSAQLIMNSGSGTSAAGCTMFDVGTVMLNAGANISLGNSCSAYSSSAAFSGGDASLVE